MEKKKHGKFWVVLIFLLFLISAGFLVGKILWQTFWSPRIPVSAVVWDEQETVEQDPVILFAAQNKFQVGELGIMELTVWCQEQVMEPITITDDRGQELAVLENDGSGELKTTVEIFEETPCYGQIQASAGEETSVPVSFYVIPEITQEMAERFLSVCTDLGDYAEQSGFEDPFSEDALDDVSAWLEADERVQTVKPPGEGLLFATTDSLIGSYGLNRTSPNTFGYVDEEEAFQVYQDGKTTVGFYIPSEIPRTNSEILHLSPYAADEIVQRFAEFFRASEEKLVERVGGRLTWTKSEDAVKKLMNGEFTNCGMAVLNTHGGLIQRKDGSDMLFMTMGEKTKAQIWELMELMNYTQLNQSVTPLENGYFNNVWGMIDDAGSIRWLVDVMIDPTGHATYHLNMTSSYLECALSDKVFDNSILYFAVCKAKSDDQMVQFLHRHGTTAFIGCRENLDVGLSIAFLEQLAEVMGTPANEYSFGTLEADDSAGTLIGRYNGDIYLLYAKDQSMKQISSTGQSFLGTVDGYCYYSTADGQEIPRATLWRVAVDGSEVVELSQVSGSKDWAVPGMDICQVVASGDLVYYSYGTYAGTGGFFQEGGIKCVDMNGTNTQVCVPYGNLGAEEFQVVENSEQTSLYYVGKEDSMGSYIGFWDDYPYTTCHVMTRKTGEETWATTQSDSYISKPGSFICVGGEILRYNEELMSYQTLIPKEAGFEFLDNPQGSEDKIALVSDLDIIGDDLYFTVDWSVRKEESFGWRPLYDRERSVFYTMKIGESEPVKLYTY